MTHQPPQLPPLPEAALQDWREALARAKTHEAVILYSSTAEALQAALSRQPAASADKCATCNGHGLVGGHMPDGSGYGEGCPECNPEPAAPVAPVAAAPERKLIGWRTENFLWETDDPDKARNWEPNIGVLPIFEGDPNTKLAASPTPPVQPDEGVQRDAALEFIDDLRQELHHRRVSDWYPEGAHNAAASMSEDMRLLGNLCADFVADDAESAAQTPLLARHISEWHEEDGPVMWWAWNGERREWAGEPAWIGSPLSEDWPGYHTHWTPHPKMPALTAAQAEGGK